MMNSLHPNSAQRFNSRLGVYLFVIYSAVYLSFALMSAFSPTLMQWQILGGVNLATWWGFGLIALAFVLALVYGFSCRDDSGEKQLPSRKEKM